MYIFLCLTREVILAKETPKKKNARSRIILTRTGNSLTKAVLFMDVEGRWAFMKYLNVFLIIKYRATQ